MKKIEQILSDGYNITVRQISSVEGGWSALAYKVECSEGDYFLKEYDKYRSSIGELIKKLDLSMPVSSWLAEYTALRGRISAPLLTTDGSTKIETKDHIYILFPYIEGITVRTVPLTLKQQKEIAEITAAIHEHGADIPFDFSSVMETFEIPCTELMKIQHNPSNLLCLHQQYDMIMNAVDKVHELADFVRNNHSGFVLCHTDIHGWNLMQSEKLILIDWESVKLAPVEADLFTFWGDWYWGDSNWGSYWKNFLPVYKKYRPQYDECEENLKFYQIRRHIEDIEEFYTQYLYDEMTEEETREVVAGITRECKFLSTLI